MQITGFKDMYIAELQELRSLEVQLDETLLRLTGMATHRSLKDLLVDYRGRTWKQRERLDSILLMHNAAPRQHTDQAVRALLAETEKMMTILKDAALRDAALIASTQKVAHYQIAAYGSAAALAGQLDLRDDWPTSC